MSAPTEEPNATYLVVLANALEAIYHDDTQTADLLRDWMREAQPEINCGQMTRQTDTVLEIARDINRGMAAA